MNGRRSSHSCALKMFNFNVIFISYESPIGTSAWKKNCFGHKLLAAFPFFSHFDAVNKLNQIYSFDKQNRIAIPHALRGIDQFYFVQRTRAKWKQNWEKRRTDQERTSTNKRHMNCEVLRLDESVNIGCLMYCTIFNITETEMEALDFWLYMKFVNVLITLTSITNVWHWKLAQKNESTKANRLEF